MTSEEQTQAVVHPDSGMTEHDQHTVSDAGAFSHWPALLCLTGYGVFIAGFAPSVFLGPADLKPSDLSDTLLRLALAVFVFVVPTIMFFRPLPRIASALITTLLYLLSGLAFLALPLHLLGTQPASGLHGIMWCGALCALAYLFYAAQHFGRAVLTPLTVLAATLLLVIGGWSAVSGIVMVQQAERLAGGKPYKIILRRPGVVFLQDPTWWQLRGVYIVGPSDPGDQHASFHHHAVLNTDRSGGPYHWSKRQMRFVPRQH